MNFMTLGKKIGFGFGLLIVIASLLGGLAMFNMRSVQADAQKLSGQYVPETDFAANLQAALSKVQLAVRSYGFMADNKYLEEGKKGLDEVYQWQQEAQKLADDHTELVKLREHLKEIDPLLKSYVAAVADTEAKNQDIVKNRDRLIGMSEGTPAWWLFG